MYTKSDFFRPARPYSGPHNPAAYQRGIERRKAQNAAMGQANRAEAARDAWLAGHADRPRIIEALQNATRSDFARSLLDGFRKYGTLTEKQEAAARKFLPEQVAATRAAQPRVAETMQFDSMVALFTTASAHLKRPIVRIGLPGTDTIRISRAGANSNSPGALNIKADGGEYLGRIHADGRWTPAFEQRGNTALTQILREFAADPAGMAAAYGKRTGECCFCAKRLTDERSTAVGYGPVCAGHYRLPWGE